MTRPEYLLEREMKCTCQQLAYLPPTSPGAASTCAAAARTVSGESAFRPRVSGQEVVPSTLSGAWGHGAHKVRTRGPRGAHTRGSVGPNRARTSGPATVAARCVRPLSLPIYNRQREQDSGYPGQRAVRQEKLSLCLSQRTQVRQQFSFRRAGQPHHA